MWLEQDQLHADLRHQSQHDQLTGLPNRRVLEDRLEQSLKHAKHSGLQVAVLNLDLDHFRQTNDTLSHSTGDSVLQYVATLLNKSVRDVDTVARQGGDEFIIILPNLDTQAEADEICERIMTNLRQPAVIGKHTLKVTAKIGLSLYPASGETATALLPNADIALHAAKHPGRDMFQHFDSVLGERLLRNIELVRELHFALELKQLSIVYQPLYSMDTQLKGFEALLRWLHPILGPVGPDQFIPRRKERPYRSHWEMGARRGLSTGARVERGIVHAGEYIRQYVGRAAESSRFLPRQ
jgi:diguanylate cyclase (GGDEF)-like protein